MRADGGAQRADIVSLLYVVWFVLLSSWLLAHRFARRVVRVIQGEARHFLPCLCLLLKFALVTEPLSIFLFLCVTYRSRGSDG